MDKKTKNLTLRFRVNEEEYEKINNLGIKLGLNHSELIRNIVLGNIYSEQMLKGLKFIPILKEYAILLDRLGLKDNILNNENDAIGSSTNIEILKDEEENI